MYISIRLFLQKNIQFLIEYIDYGFFFNIENGHLHELLFNTRFYGGIHI